MSIVTKEYNSQVVEFDLTDDMMVSLTDMAKANDKQVSEWIRLDTTQSYLEALRKSDMQKSHITTVRGNFKDGRSQGTWATKRVAIRFAQWLSDDFAIWVDTQIEELLTKGTVSIKTPQTYKEALLALIEKEEALERAIATKAEIGSRREATAMNTASQAVKRANDLEIQLDKAKQYATVKKMEQHFKRKFQWQPLKKASVDMGYEIQKVFDANYENGINSYHIDVWLEVYGVWID